MARQLKTLSTLISITLLASACSSEPRSMEYFAEDLEEADQILKDCETGAARGKECENASLARLQAKNKAHYEEGSRKEAETMKSGKFMPKLNP